MAKYVTTYCKKCGKETTHKIGTEDFWGLEGGWRILGAIASCGASIISSESYSVCCSCGHKKYI